MLGFQIKFRCPNCSAGIEHTDARCRACGRAVRSDSGILDFVSSNLENRERAFYEQVYAELPKTTSPAPLESLRVLWEDAWQPQNQLVLNMLGDLRGKRILLLGNGQSAKELWLLSQRPAAVVYSDLSAHAVVNIRDRFSLHDHTGQLAFAAIDAQQIPLFPDTVDVVYGYAMVHHLPDLERFVSEVMRVLAPGGRAVFMDDAYSPVWHVAKQTFLRPLMRLSHRRSGISPEDYRFSMSGGFRERSLAAIIQSHGGRPWFVRTSFLQYLWQRAAEKLLPEVPRRIAMQPRVAQALHRVDRVCAKTPFVSRQLIRLVWGLEKDPVNEGTACG